MTTSEKIRKLRRERDWTQDELGARVGIDKRNVSRYETGSLNPSKKTLAKFASALGVNVEELREEPSQPSLVLDDPELLNLFREIATLPDKSRNAVKTVLAMVVKQNRIQQMVTS